MKIIREINGRNFTFELTKQELFEAYKEQEEIYAVDNIEVNMENYLEYDEYIKLKDNHEFIKNAAYVLMENQNEFDMTFDKALERAIEEVKEMYI